MSQGKMKTRLGISGLLLAAAVLGTLAQSDRASAPAPAPGRMSVIVQAGSLSAAAAAVRATGGEVTHELGIIDAVGAQLTREQAARLAAACAGCRVHEDRVARLTGPPITIPDSDFPALVGADRLHDAGLRGSGVTIAVVDSGFWPVAPLLKDSSNANRVLAQYDAFANVVRTKSFTNDDTYGHGTHVAGIAVASLRSTTTGKFLGVAPGAKLVSVKAFDGAGASTYATVIRAIDWVVTNRTTYGIRILNASFGAPVGSWYWEDPLNQAVMRAWQAGIVVVTSAGNTGPNAMTVTAPGNVPYVVTVGAMTDNYTPAYGSDDYLASFSAAGPTYEGHVKPDLVAPGGHILAGLEKPDYLGRTFPQYFVDDTYFRLSGTSQAAAVVSGVAALVLQQSPGLTPDDVKCRLIATADPAVDVSTGSKPYSIFQQGAGLVDAYRAVNSTETGCANAYFDINRDLAGVEHYAGPVAQETTGLRRYYLTNDGSNGFQWDGKYLKGSGYPWTSGYPWASGYPWTNGYPWTSGYPWTNGYPWTSSTTATTDASLAAKKGVGNNKLVPQL